MGTVIMFLVGMAIVPLLSGWVILLIFAIALTAYSEANRPAITMSSGHPLRSKPATL
jgi:hypothetical protein